MDDTEPNGEAVLPQRTKPSLDETKAALEAEFLSPPTSFSADWLNKLQHRWDEQVDYSEITQLAPTQSRTVTRFTREGLEGRVTGYKEVTVPASSATAKNSTSILRRPADRADFVRGAAGFFPFAPGGLDGVDAIQAYEDETTLEAESQPQKKSGGLDRIINFSSGDGLLEIPPGFTRGMRSPDKKNSQAEVEAEEVKSTLQEADDVDIPTVNGHFNGEIPSSGTATPSDELEEEETDLDDLEELLPVEFPSLAPHGQLLASSSRKGGKEWAHVVDVNKDIPNFHELVPEMARTWPFELDTFQKEAVYHLENGDSVFVAAHTSAGKTVVAEYAIALAARHMTKAIYTSPIKALSNQKFRDFKDVFDDVGILTGDVQINAEASCLIMTTEILRSMLYRGADLIRDVEFVIFDEVHYVSDAERGVVWEEVIIMLPDHVNVVLLSATVPNTFEFASWVGRTKKKNIYVISTAKRPVPLEHYLWSGKEMHKIVDSNKKFLEKGWKEANDIMSGKDKIKEQAADGGAARGGQTGTRGPVPQRGGRGGQQQRGGSNQRGGSQPRGQASNRGQGNIARTGRGGGRTSAAQDRNVWVHLVHHLRKENLLPTCIFVFSKKRCEENADSLSNQDFCTAAEKSQIHMIVEKSIARLKPDDRMIPQIRKIKEKLARGVAVHHGGLLPIVKEIVEILFARTLVKVLFATETFAMGLNLPTRTVAFSGYRKHDGKEFRNLTPGEYTQMAGRAGRRGIDTVGTVIVVSSGKSEAPSVLELRAMIIAPPTKLKSQFRLHYNMMLNLLRVEALKIEEMIKRSFSESATQALLPQHERDIAGNQATLEKIKREPCPICDVDLEAFHDAAVQYEKLTKELQALTLNTPVGRRIWTAKRMIVYKRDQIRTVGVLVEDGVRAASLKVLEIGSVDRKVQSSDVLPYLPDLKFRHMLAPLPTDAEHIKCRVVSVPVEDVECVTRTLLKTKGPGWYIKLPKFQKQIAEEEFPQRYSSWYTRDWDEVDWSSDTAITVRDLITEREKLVPVIVNANCLECPNFLKHFEMQHAEWLVKTQIKDIMHQMSDQNLALLPDYNQRIEVLKDLGFIDTESRVLLKGKVACEIHSADELVLTELILDNILAEFEPAEIVALLSSFVFQEKSDVDPYHHVTSSLQRGITAITAISKRVNDVQTLHQVLLSSDDADFESQPRFGLVEVVYNWAEGMGFKEIMDLTDVMEGTIVRVVTRLDETCREVMSAARLIGDPGLYAKMEKAREMIRRDVVFTASLYM